MGKNKLKMHGLLRTSLSTCYIPDDSPYYTQIEYNISSGTVSSIRCNSDDGLRIPHSEDVIIVCATRRHMSMWSISYTVKCAVEMYMLMLDDMQGFDGADVVGRTETNTT